MKDENGLIEFLKDESHETKTPAEYCPNCWGRQEYGGHFYEAIKQKGLNANTLEKEKGWVLGFAELHLHDIKLHPSDGYLKCHRCNIRYEEAD